MNVSRKIQLTAAAVIANGALALAVLTPSTAFAACMIYVDTVCTGGECIDYGPCPPPRVGCKLLENTACSYCSGYSCEPCQGYSYNCVYGP
jgi:hypothetical protein